MKEIKAMLTAMWRSISHCNPVYCDYEGPMALSDLELSRIGLTRYEAATDWRRSRMRVGSMDAFGGRGGVQPGHPVVVNGRLPKA